MTQTPDGYYTTMAALCGTKIMTVFSEHLIVVHWPFDSDNTDEKMHPLYGWGDSVEAASKMFLERNGLLP